MEKCKNLNKLNLLKKINKINNNNINKLYSYNIDKKGYLLFESFILLLL